MKTKGEGGTKQKSAPIEGATRSPTTDAIVETGPGRCQTGR